jgi:hypothetical protein
MRYALVAVEVSMHKAFGRLLGAKSEVATARKELVAFMEWQTYCKLKTLRTDNSTEFVNSKIEQLCKQNSITH